MPRPRTSESNEPMGSSRKRERERTRLNQTKGSGLKFLPASLVFVGGALSRRRDAGRDAPPVADRPPRPSHVSPPTASSSDYRVLPSFPFLFFFGAHRFSGRDLPSGILSSFRRPSGSSMSHLTWFHIDLWGFYLSFVVLSSVLRIVPSFTEFCWVQLHPRIVIHPDLVRHLDLDLLLIYWVLPIC